MAKTMDVAPLSPDQDTRLIWLIFALNGAIKANTLNGLDTNVRNTAIKIAGIHTFINDAGVESIPSRKKIRICINAVTPSKKFITSAVPLSLALPMIIPTMYTLR